MRGRVDKLSLDSSGEDEETEKKEEIFVDMTETGEYAGEGEFSIIGKKEEEFEKPRERDKEQPDKHLNLQEIKSLEHDLNLFEGFETPPKDKSSKSSGKKSLKDKKKPEVFSEEKISFSDINEDMAEDQKEGVVNMVENVIDTKEANEDLEISDISESTDTTESNEEKIPEPKKTKLKFGFKDGE